MKRSLEINKIQIKRIRFSIQLMLAIFMLFMGYRLYQFTLFFLEKTDRLVQRPPSVEGFLPISALLSLRVFISGGGFDQIHPAGLIILISAIITAWLLRKSFCGWLCPVGALSEQIGILAHKWKLQIKMPRIIDLPLKSLKYLLLIFFAKIIFMDMPIQGVYGFLQSDYNKIADVRMLMFFLNLSSTAALVLFSLIFLSILFKHFWCRYLCPYGALLGIFSLLSPTTIVRNEAHCIDCYKCDQVCLTDIKVSRVKRLYTPECVGCLNCVEVCPKKKVLELKLFSLSIPKIYFAAALIAIFFGIIILGQITGHWESSLNFEDYQLLIPAFF